MIRRLLLSSLAFTAGATLLTACGSVKSKIYDSDNVTSSERQIKCLHGIPETVDVPTHIVIRVNETKYYRDSQFSLPVSKKDDTTAKEDPKEITTAKVVNIINAELAKKNQDLTNLIKKGSEPGSQNTENANANQEIINKLKEEIATLQKQLAALTPANRFVPIPDLTGKSMSYNFVTRKELYTVDFKRPASGTGELKLAYGNQSDGQFFSKINQTTTDTTITDTAALIKQLASTLNTVRTISDAEEKKAEAAQRQVGIFSIAETVAVEYFNIHEPNLEGRIQDFLNQYINNCSPGCFRKGTPKPESIPLVQIPEQEKSSPTVLPKPDIQQPLSVPTPIPIPRIVAP